MDNDGSFSQMLGGLTAIFVFHYLWQPVLFTLAHAENWGEGWWREIGYLSGGGAGGQWWGAVAILLAPSMSPHSLTQSLSCVWPFVTPWTIAHQAPLAMEFFRQEYCSACYFLLQGDLPDPRIKPMSPVSCALAGGFLTTEPPGKLLQSLNLGITTFGCPPISRS